MAHEQSYWYQFLNQLVNLGGELGLCHSCAMGRSTRLGAGQYATLLAAKNRTSLGQNYRGVCHLFTCELVMFIAIANFVLWKRAKVI